MARKRMFNIQIVDSDAFLDMPLSTQALYFHLNMRADDDGFVGNPKRIQRLVGASEDDLKLLIAKRFLLVFEDGVIVIKHWRMHNTIQRDRYTRTAYIEELNQLKLKDNKSYTFHDIDAENSMETKCLQNGNKMETDWKQNDNTDIGLDLDIDLDIDLEEETNKEEETDAAPSPPSLFESFESEFARPLSPIEVQLIADWQKAYSNDIIMLALAEGVKNNARSFRYIEVILNAWKQAGVRNVEEAKMQIEKKQSDKSPKSKITELPNWYHNQELVQPKGIHVDDEELKKLQNMLND
jgi:DnaD/phage-associated family protein|nr:MAG TPA: replisome organizer [Caudoviricetes sp.]